MLIGSSALAAASVSDVPAGDLPTNLRSCNARSELRGWPESAFLTLSSGGDSLRIVKIYQPTVTVSRHGLSPYEVLCVARGNATVAIAPEAIAAMVASAAHIDRFLASATPVYGVTTGFGSLASTVIPAERTAELQRALVRSHAAGMGAFVEREVVRAMMVLRLRSLCMGYSGVRPLVAHGIAALLNAGITPMVHEYGSLGASGDLAPLAHAALTLLGEGFVTVGNGEIVSALEALESAGLAPIELRAKEGLALINGTDGILGMLVMALDDLDDALATADVVAAMTTESLLGTDRAWASDLQALRPHVGQARSAARMTSVISGSAIRESHRTGDGKVQDAYSLRCTPQVHGAALDTVAYAHSVAGTELASAIDNPMILPDGRVESCGNFHGAPVAYVCDFLAIAVADVGALSERRTDRMLDAHRSAGLPPFLAPDAGVNSGMMIAHYTQAAMVMENRRLAVPASVDTLPTSALQEDHVSMGWAAARKLRVSVSNYQRILGVELSCAARALDLRSPLQPSPVSAAVVAAVREVASGPGPDRWLAPELSAVTELVATGAVLDAAAGGGLSVLTSEIASDLTNEGV